jgi:hypothetical protein
MQDANTVVQTSITSVALAHSAAFTLPGGTPRRGDVAVFLYSAATNASGSNSVAFSIDVSRDGGSTFNIEFEAPPIALSTTAQAGEVHIPFSISPTSVANGCQIKASANFVGAGSTPTITWQCALEAGRP